MNASPVGRVVEASTEALDVIDHFYQAIYALEVVDDKHRMVALAQFYAMFSVARSALYLIRTDPVDSMYSAIILLRSHLELFMRASFIAGPATAAELEHFLAKDELPTRHGQRLGPNSLAKINTAHYEWEPPERVPSVVRSQWESLCGFSHGGRATLAFFLGGGEVGPDNVGEAIIPDLVNLIAISAVALGAATTLGRNVESDAYQAVLRSTHAAAMKFVTRWNEVALPE